MRRGIAIFFMVQMAGPLPTRAAIVTLPAARDNTLYEVNDGSLSNGSGQYLFVGRTMNETVRRGLIAFDVAGVIPANSVVVSASLNLHMSRTPTAAQSIELHRVLSGWGEGASVGFGQEGGGAPAQTGDATWLHRFYNDQFWQNAGGDFDPQTRAAQIVIGPGFYTWSSPGLVADVQSWLNSPGSNFGWLVLGNEELDSTTKRFDSRQNNDPAVRPTLVVEYQLAPEPATALGICLLLPMTSGRLGWVKRQGWASVERR
jgi:hypothetical protein